MGSPPVMQIPFKIPFRFSKWRENLFLRDHRLQLRVQHQIAVLAEGAAEIAASQKNSAGHLSRIVQQGQGLKSMNFHTSSFSEAGIPRIS